MKTIEAFERHKIRKRYEAIREKNLAEAQLAAQQASQVAVERYQQERELQGTRYSGVDRVPGRDMSRSIGSLMQEHVRQSRRALELCLACMSDDHAECRHAWCKCDCKEANDENFLPGS